MTYKELSLECQKCKHKKMCEECDTRMEREKMVIDVINTYINQNGYSPSVTEIGKAIGVHKSNAHVMLSRMAEKGYITYGKGKLGITRVL